MLKGSWVTILKKTQRNKPDGCRKRKRHRTLGEWTGMN